MSDLLENLRTEFQDPEYRYAYAESFLNTKLATQIKVLREARGLTQADLGRVVGTKQSGFSRFEDVNHSSWKTDTLWKIARGLGVRVNISFETFGSLIEDKKRFKRESLLRPTFEDDPAFKAPAIGGGNFSTAVGAYIQSPFRASSTIGLPYESQPEWIGFESVWSRYGYPAISAMTAARPELLDEFGIPLSKRPGYTPSNVEPTCYTATLSGVWEALTKPADESRYIRRALTPPTEVSAQVSKMPAAA